MTKQSPNLVFANGIAGFIEMVGVSKAIAMSIMLMAFTTFVYDTLDVCARLGRYIIQELTGWHNKKGAWIGTIATAAVPLLFVTQQSTDATGKAIPAWRVFWPLFGSANQLLAALALLGISVWLHRTKPGKAWLLTAIPCAFMYTMSCWALIGALLKGQLGGAMKPEAWVALVLLTLAGWLLIEAIVVIGKGSSGRLRVPQQA